MNIDHFFSIEDKTTSTQSTFESKVGLIGFFLCSFDTLTGLQILFTYPSKLQKDKLEINILKTHCIWKMEDIPQSIELRFSEFVYSAFQLHASQDETLEKKYNPIYAIIIKNWKDNNPLPMHIFLEYISKLELEIGPNLDLLYRCKKLASNPIKKRKFQELSKKAVEIENSLKLSWHSFVDRFSEKKGTLSKNIDEEVETPIFPIESHRNVQDLFKRKITLETFVTSENPNTLMVILVNQSKDLKDVSILVSRRKEFFSEVIWEHEIEDWPYKEEIMLEFPRSEAEEDYLVIINSKKTRVDIKSLKVDSLTNELT